MDPAGPSPLIPTPSPGPAPLTPEPEEDRPGRIHASPSFDYHEERRLHLKDEIWLSHHLPRLPPPTVTEGGGSASVSPESTLRPTTKRATPANLVLQHDDPNSASPSAFHPRPNHLRPYGDQDPHDGVSPADPSPFKLRSTSPNDVATAHPRASAIEAFPGSSMLSPSGPGDGDLDPAPAMIHRQELDDQEKLDLEEEETERALNAARGLGGMDRLTLGTELEKGQSAAPAEPPVPNGTCSRRLQHTLLALIP